MEKMELSEALKANASVLEGLLGINDTWFRYRNIVNIESQAQLDSMNSSGIYALSSTSQLEYVRSCMLVVIGKPKICCIQKLYDYNKNIYNYRMKLYEHPWSNWRSVSFT